MAPWPHAALSLLAIALAGCLSAPAPVEEAGLPGVGSATQVAWKSAQMASHPAFGWPTMNAPAEGLEAALPEWWEPIAPRALPASITKLTHLAAAPERHVGAGIAVFGSLVAVPGLTGQAKTAFRLYDIRDPASPRLLAAPEGTPGRDADFVAYPDGRLVLVMASNFGVDPVWDVSEPTNPQLLAEIEPPRGSHNILVVPGTPILYNSNSNGGGAASNVPQLAQGSVEIYDLTDPANPVLVQDFKNGYGCHDMTAFIDAAQGKFRAYCAGVQATQIWDIADPRNPVVLASIGVPHGRSDIPSTAVLPFIWSHTAEVNHDASVLIVADETGGGGLPGCDIYAEAAGRTASGPLGNLWFYDLRDERNPVLKGWLSPPSTLATNAPGEAVNCTSHFGRVLEDRPLAAWAFYSAGVLLVDFSDLGAPRIVAQFRDGSNTWDVWYYQGYLFTGDIARGLDVLVPE